MKKILSTCILVASTLLATTLLASCQPKNRIIEKPFYLTRNTPSIEVSRISLMDTITILDMIVSGMPDTWIGIAPTSTLTDNQKNVYTILSGKGIKLGEGFVIPASGKGNFQLLFPTLNPDAQWIDFSEGPEVKDGFMIGGIQLKDMQPLESILPKDILTSKTDKNLSMEEQPFVFGETTIKGKVLDYNEGMHQYVNITSFNPLIGNSGYVFIQLKPDGSFEHKLNVLGTSIVWVHYAGSATTAEIFAAPKQTSEVYFNIREAARKKSDIHADTAPLGKEFYYKGPLSTVVYELSEVKKLLREEYKVYDFKKTPEELLEEYKQVQFGGI